MKRFIDVQGPDGKLEGSLIAIDEVIEIYRVINPAKTAFNKGGFQICFVFENWHTTAWVFDDIEAMQMTYASLRKFVSQNSAF